MNLIKKVLKWLLVIVAIIAVLFAVLVFFVTGTVRDAEKEAAEFLTDATKPMCIDEMAKRISKCDSASCMASTAAFGSTCVFKAKGDRFEFCESVPASDSDYSKGTWQTDYCGKYELGKQGCDGVFNVLKGYCARSSK